MGNCAAIQYQGVPRARFSCLQQAAEQQLNIAIGGDAGSASDPGGDNTVTWDFDEAASVLTLQAVNTGYPCFLVKQKLNSFMGTRQ